MIRPTGSLAVYLCVEPVDFRKQIPGLATIVQGDLELNPFEPSVFGFVNRKRDQCRLLLWERNGFVLWNKRLERERFWWPQAGEPTVTLSVEQLNWLLDGLDLSRWQPHRALQFEAVC